MIEYLERALKEGSYLLVKYGLIVIVIVYAYSFMIKTYQMAMNGQQAAIAIQEFQKKGWLPQLINGQVPDSGKNK